MCSSPGKIHLTVGNTSSVRADLQLKSTINHCSQVLGFSGESQFSSSPVFSGGEGLLAATLPSPAQILLICHTCPAQTSIPLLGCSTNDSLRLHLWRAPFLTNPQAPGQTAQHKLWRDKAWLICNSTALSTVRVGWVQPLKEGALTLNAQKQLNPPPLSTVLQELPTGNKESKPTFTHRENWTLFFLEKHSAAVVLRVFTPCLGLQPVSSITIFMI